MYIEELNKVSWELFGNDFEDLRSGYQKEAVYNYIRFKQFEELAKNEIQNDKG